jgi:hypothetical protein
VISEKKKTQLPRQIFIKNLDAHPASTEVTKSQEKRIPDHQNGLFTFLLFICLKENENTPSYPATRTTVA